MCDFSVFRDLCLESGCGRFGLGLLVIFDGLEYIGIIFLLFLKIILKLSGKLFRYERRE